MNLEELAADVSFNSREWASIKSYLLGARQVLLEMNSNPSLSEVETALVRGRIQQVSELLNLEESRNIGITS